MSNSCLKTMGSPELTSNVETGVLSKGGCMVLNVNSFGGEPSLRNYL